MGNYISCTLASPGRHPRGARVILPTGEIHQLDAPANAAELMLETPNHFLVNTQSLQINRRFFPLSADEELEMGHVYAMFPMRRLNSMITPADVGTLLITASSLVKRTAGGKARVQPEAGSPPVALPQPEKCSKEGGAPRLKLEAMDDEMVGEMRGRLSMCRSRRPMLETIAEEPVSSR